MRLQAIVTSIQLPCQLNGILGKINAYYKITNSMEYDRYAFNQ